MSLSEDRFEEFARYLKKIKKKKPNVVERNVRTMSEFFVYLRDGHGANLETVSRSHIDDFVEWILEEKKSPKGYLYVLMNYFGFTEQQELRDHAKEVREGFTKKSRKVFKLKEFVDINLDYVSILKEHDIENVEQMLEAGHKLRQRKDLSKKTGIPVEVILEMVQLSDLTRLGYIKAKLARLYHNAGITSPQILASYEPEQLQEHFKNYIEESGWDGTAPYLKDLKYNINNARQIDPIVEL